MLFKVLVKTDLEIQLFLGETTMTDCKILVNKFNGEERLWGMEWHRLFDARAIPLVVGKIY